MIKKILHLCNSSPITRSYIDFINENFEKENHFFVIFPTSFIYDYPSNCLVITRKNAKFNYLKVLLMSNRASKIILHGFFYNLFITRVLIISPWNIKKCYWVIWGGDLYDEVEQVEYTKTLRYRKFFFFKKWIIKNIPYFVTYLEYDYQLAIKHYNSKAKLIDCIMYPSNVFTSLDQDIKPKASNNEELKILLGNSASEANNHEEIIHLLANIQTKAKFTVYCPLSYGNMEHAQKMKDLGGKTLGERFIPLEGFMPINEYKVFLESIDIAVFNHRRQEAMGNIISLLGMGTTLYIRNYTSNSFLCDKLDIHIFHINDLILNGIRLLTEEERNKNSKIIRYYFNKNTLISQSKNIFDN